MPRAVHIVSVCSVNIMCHVVIIRTSPDRLFREIRKKNVAGEMVLFCTCVLNTVVRGGFDESHGLTIFVFFPYRIRTQR